MEGIPNYTVHAEAAEGLAAEIIATGGRAIVAVEHECLFVPNLIPNDCGLVILLA
jgi:hypothetical protein